MPLQANGDCNLGTVLLRNCPRWLASNLKHNNDSVYRLAHAHCAKKIGRHFRGRPLVPLAPGLSPDAAAIRESACRCRRESEGHAATTSANSVLIFTLVQQWVQRSCADCSQFASVKTLQISARRTIIRGSCRNPNDLAKRLSQVCSTSVITAFLIAVGSVPQASITLCKSLSNLASS